MSQLEARLNATLGPRDQQWGSFPTADLPLVTWLRDGTVFIHMGDDTKLSVRVPLVSGLSVSSGILDWISTRNSAQYAGHYWLRPGADEHNWQLVCEVKFPWDWFDQHLADVVTQACPGLGTVLNRDVAPDFIRQFGGQPWWDSACAAEHMGAQILALLD
ncbi:hypothetical protein [Mycobacterium sp. E802]|uniref:hypothetical protein n=1 Tax=Mycobacterium sp. E802 TaxID=1834152 RepID=UPI000A9811D5|nr:hypothetical protein [Mycobacterium sp. E802]